MGYFPDRLVSEMRLAQASTIEEANKVLADFLPRYNQRFAITAIEPGLAYRKPEDDFKPEEVFCFKYQRRVGADNVIRLEDHRLQIQPTNGRLSYAHALVEVNERLDGSLAVCYQGHSLLTTPAPSEAPVLRVRNIHKPKPIINHLELTAIAAIPSSIAPKHKPAPDHPWKRSFKAHIDRG